MAPHVAQDNARVLRDAWLITGATDGIGLELARQAETRRVPLLLHGRRPGAGLAPAPFFAGRYLQADLADPRAPERIAARLDELGVTRLGRLVLNAADGWVGSLEQLPEVRARALLEVDLVAPLRLVHLLLPRLRAARGRIVFISSIATRFAAPRYAAYAAAKCAAEGFFRSLALELADAVEVQVLRLGAVRTGLHAKSGFELDPARARRWPSAAAAARALAAHIDGPARDATIGLANRALAGLGRAVPALVDALSSARGPTRPPQPAPGRVLVTGGAAGIGRALAERLVQRGHAPVLLDRDAPGLARARAELGGRVETIRADLTDPEELARVLAELALGTPLDTVVHNAGISATGRFEELSWESQRRVLELNLVAPLVLSSALLARGLVAPGASFAFVSSLSRFVGYPGASVYAASKDGLAHFARSLRVHRARSGGHVLTVYPGPTRTEHARRHSPDNSREHRRMPPEVLAEHVVRALEVRRHVLVPGLANRAAALFGHCCPALAGRAMRRAMLPTSSGRR